MGVITKQVGECEANMCMSGRRTRVLWRIRRRARRCRVSILRRHQQGGVRGEEHGDEVEYRFLEEVELLEDRREGGVLREVLFVELAIGYESHDHTGNETNEANGERNFRKIPRLGESMDRGGLSTIWILQWVNGILRSIEGIDKI